MKKSTDEGPVELAAAGAGPRPWRIAKMMAIQSLAENITY